MYVLALIFPLLGSIMAGLFGRFFGRLGSANLAIVGLFATMCLGWAFFLEANIYQSTVVIKLYNWFLLDLYNVELGLLYDTASLVMVVVIGTISFFVHLYSKAYMSHDPHLSRFMCYLSFFTFFMLVLVTSDNFVQLFVGWEGVGLCSYLLINFWFTRILANKAAMKAMVMNRIADVFFTLGIIIILISFRTTDFAIVFNLVPSLYAEKVVFCNVLVSKLDLITIFLFIGAIGKSAQLGFHTWLPVAMEGPTPVSALLHAATMVTAGVFLVIRSSLFFEYSEASLFLLCIFGSSTALFSGLVAAFQVDIKRIIAYSTCSQLGYMFFSCGLSNYHVAFFHLFNHAFFKALLFLSAGALIHSLFDEQDIRRMGGLARYFPFIYLSILVGSLAILGTPFLSGFYSKDLMIELAYSRYWLDSFYIFVIAVVAAILTAMYSFKLLYYVFFHNFNIGYTLIVHWKSNDTEVFDIMFISMFCLIFFSVMSGYLFSDMFVGYGSPFWNNSIFAFSSHFLFIDVEYISALIKNLPIISCFLSMGALSLIFAAVPRLAGLGFAAVRSFSPFFYYGLFFDKVYNWVFAFILKESYNTPTKCVDKGFLELLGPFGLYKFFRALHYDAKYAVEPLLFNDLFIFFLSLFVFLLGVIICFTGLKCGFAAIGLNFGSGVLFLVLFVLKVGQRRTQSFV